MRMVLRNAKIAQGDEKCGACRPFFPPLRKNIPMQRLNLRPKRKAFGPYFHSFRAAFVRFLSRGLGRKVGKSGVFSEKFTFSAVFPKI